MKLLIQIFIAIIPLIYSFSSSDPTLNIRFLSLSIVTSLLLLYQIFKNSKIAVNVIRHPVFWCLILLEISFLLSSFINGFNSEAVYLLLKFFLLSLFTFILTDFLLKFSFKDLLISFLLFSLFTSIIYIYQLIDNYQEILSIEDIWHRNRAFDKISGSMGHKNLLASIQFLILPFLIYLLSDSRRYIKALALFAIILIVFQFFQIQSRAIFGALLISLSAYFITTNFNFKKLKKLFIYTFLFTFLGLAFIYSTARLDSFKKEITKTIDFSSSQRFSLYNSSIKLIIDNPIFGAGPGNWRIKIWEYDLYFNTFGDSFAQRPHNDFLWVFSEGGLIAGLSYLLLFLILLRDSYFLSKNSKNAKNNFLFKLIFCVLIGYGFVSMLDFPLERFSHLIIFFLIAAIVISERIRNENLQIFYIPLWIKGFLFALCIFSVYIGFIRYNGEVNVTNALKFKKRNKLVSVVKAINKGYSSNFYDIEGTSTPLLWYRGLAYFKMGKYDLALNDFKSAYDVNPNHIHVLNNLATSYDMLGDYKKAKEFYNKALKVNPTFKEARVNLAAIIYNDKDYLTALDIILESKIDLYWRRVRDNDNYDLYLKTIFQAWANKEIIDLDNNNKEILNSLIVYFEEYPASAERKLRAVFNKKIELGINYIQSLLIIEEEIKSHTKFKY